MHQLNDMEPYVKQGNIISDHVNVTNDAKAQDNNEI